MAVLSCPVCGEIMNTHHLYHGNGRDGPRQGDVCICMKCHTPSILDDDKLRVFTANDQLMLHPDDADAVEEGLRHLREREGRPN